MTADRKSHMQLVIFFTHQVKELNFKQQEAITKQFAQAFLVPVKTSAACRDQTVGMHRRDLRLDLPDHRGEESPWLASWRPEHLLVNLFEVPAGNTLYFVTDDGRLHEYTRLNSFTVRPRHFREDLLWAHRVTPRQDWYGKRLKHIRFPEGRDRMVPIEPTMARYWRL